jgi:hypothetical protein
MKSSEVYSVLSEHMVPLLKTAGFKRAKAMLSWARPQQERYLVIWCQVSQDGWDSYAGSKFVLEFQLSETPVVGGSQIRRERLALILDKKGREEIRKIQNQVIASLRRPPSSYPLLHVSEGLRDHYLGKFLAINEPFGDRDDIWLRYGSREHVATWAQFIVGKLPECFERVDTWA